MSKKTSYVINDIAQFQLPWHDYGHGLSKPEYSEARILELFREANPRSPVKKVKITSTKGSNSTVLEVKHGDGELNVPDALKKYFV